MSRRHSLLASILALGALLALPGELRAGAFIFAGDANGIDVVAHPDGYSGLPGEIEVSLCIDPASPNAADMEIPVQNIAATFNDLLAFSPNLFSGADNNIPPGAFDFESVALHEVGHCIGLAHPNLGSQSGVTSTNSTNAVDGSNNSFDEGAGGDGIFGSADDSRGDDVTLHWFRVADNNPFLLGSVFDSTTYSRDIGDLPPGDLFPANADRTVGSILFGVSDTEAVMQQGSGSDEDQRRLAADDVATLRYAMSGLDELEGTLDDYTFRLVYAGLTTSCDVVLRFNNAATGFANCVVSGSFLPGDHIVITSGTASFNTGFSWFFNDVLLTEGLIFQDGFESGGVGAWSESSP